MEMELRYIGEKIVKNSSVLARRISEAIDSNCPLDLNELEVPASTLHTSRSELVRYFGQALYEDPELIRNRVIDWGKKAAKFAIEHHLTLSKSLRAITFYRTVIWDIFTEELKEKRFAAITMLDVSKMIDPLLDKVFEVVSDVYENRSNDLMKVAYSAVEELSVPVVPIMEGIGIIPLIGTIDTNRAQLIMDIALNEGARLGLTALILDVSGVPIIDTMVANQLFKIVSALELTGIQAVVTGIRPELAQTIVALGLDFSQIGTQSSLQKALKQLGLRLEKI